MSGVRDLVYSSALYRVSLRGRFHHGLAFQPDDPWPGNPERANELFQGTYTLGGQTVTVGANPPWRNPDGGDAWRSELHAFSWLRHFREAGGDSAVRAARSLAGTWHSHCGTYDPFIWRPDILARRLTNWCLNADLLIRHAELTYRSNILRSFGRQAKHLSRTADQMKSGAEGIATAVGLALVGYCLPESRAYAEKGLRLLADQLSRQILSDGGHVSRSPETLERVLRDLVLLKRVMMEVGEPAPDALINAIDRITPTLKLFRHGDGGLALFNGGTAGDADAIEITVKRSGIRGKPNLSALRSGYERLQGDRTAVICDFGGPDPQPGIGHAGLLSFELSHRRERIVVNSGASRPPSAQWQAALASTAAHSTLTVDDTNAVPVPEAGRKRRRGMETEAVRTESAEATWLDMSHDGYRQAYGITHRRRLYLDAAGRDFRGEDTLEPAPSKSRRSVPFAIRFHLHPDVQAVPSQGGDAVLLRLKSGRGWRFRMAGAELKIEDGVYLGDGRPRKTRQIVLHGVLEQEALAVHWAFGLIEGADA
ncbi:MAG: heparinase II/III family protein [Minwuia sp.]|uniref:heparinase II/III family protein n=1 Tax=Minwuia sp. TaxID=2493630 RepID=UPI003A854406